MSVDGAHVLLIEDDRQIRRFLRVTLEAAHLSVTEAGRGQEGLDQFALCRPDLVILDLGLPDMDGVQVVAQLRTLTAVPVLILSARNEEAQKVSALDAGADDYLTKPFGNAELMARIRVHLRKRGAPVQQQQFGAIEVDFDARRVTRDGAEVHLTPTEYDLLCVLLRNPGKVLTHTYLLRTVWGAGHAERSHYLRVYMGHLRHKLERDPARPEMIVTEAGVGYRWMG